ncbi:MAG: thioredoxin [Acidobacteria bacterium]|nr:thioredoxin [Acidobacteriota bacterium]
MSVNRRTNRWSGVAALGAALLLAACGGGSPTSTSPPSTTPTAVDSAVVALEAANFDATVATGVTLVEFYHPTCSHCRAMEPVVEQLATDFRGQAVVGKVNVTTDQALTQAWGVRGYPTFVVIKGGSEQSRLLGETSYARLAGMIRAALAAS